MTKLCSFNCYSSKSVLYKVKLFPITGTVPQLQQINYDGAAGIATNIPFEELISYEIFKEEQEKLQKFGKFKLKNDHWTANLCEDCRLNFITNFKDSNYEVEICKTY